MKNILSNVSVTNRLLAISIIFVVTVVIIAMDVISTLEKNKQDGTVINVAGRQRMLTKKFASEVMLTLQKQSQVTAPQLNYENTCTGQVQQDTFFREFSNSIGDRPWFAECSLSRL